MVAPFRSCCNVSAASLLLILALSSNSQAQFVEIPIDDSWSYAGYLGEQAFFLVGERDGPDERVLWMYDGESIKPIGPGSLMVSHYENMVIFSREGEQGIWGWDGVKSLEVAEFLPGLEGITRLNILGDFKDRTLINAWSRNDDGPVGLYQSSPDGFRQLTERDIDGLIVIDDVAHLVGDTGRKNDSGGTIVGFHTFDGEVLTEVGEIDGFPRVRFKIGNVILTTTTRETYRLENGNIEGLGQQYDLLDAREYDDGWVYFRRHDNQIWRTDGTAFEHVLTTEDRLLLLPEVEGNLHYITLGAENYLYRVDDGEGTLVGGPNLEGWLAAPAVGMLIIKDGSLFKLTGGELVPQLDDEFRLIGIWQEDILIGLVPGSTNPHTIRFGSTGVDSEQQVPDLPASISVSNFPNPVQARATIRIQVAQEDQYLLEIADVLGRRVQLLHRGRLPAGTHDMPFDRGDLVDGLYLMRVISSDRVTTGAITVGARR